VEHEVGAIEVHGNEADGELIEVTLLHRSAFDFEPDEPADFLLCDMAFRPLEVASMLARYARTRTARFLIANFKLPMKRKAEIVARIREVLEAGGFRGLRVRQLYHDRDEVTVFARA